MLIQKLRHLPDTFLVMEQLPVAEDGVYFVRSADGHQSVMLYHFANGRLTTVLEEYDGGVDLSTSNGWLLYERLGQAEADLMLVENFR